MCITARCGCVDAKVIVNRPSWDEVYKRYNDCKKTSDMFKKKSLNYLNGQINSLPESNTCLVFNALIDAPGWTWSKKHRSPIDNAKVLKEWLSESDVWGKRDDEISIKNETGFTTVKNIIGGRDGVCIIIRGTRKDTSLDQAVLWGGESEDMVGVDTRIDKGDTVYFWELKGIMDSGENWIWSRGDKVFWMVGKYGDTSEERQLYSFDARSGAKTKLPNGEDNDQRNANCQYEIGGPTVVGDYKLNLEPDPSRIAKFNKNELLRNTYGGIEQIPIPFIDAWGLERVRLEKEHIVFPQHVINCDRDIHSFYFHDSRKGSTSGCTEVDGKFFELLKKYRAKMKKEKCKKLEIRVKVDYKVTYPKNHITRTRLDYEDD